MVLPNYYLVSSYKSTLCAAMECYLRVSGLFLLFALLSESPSSIAPLLCSTVHCSCSMLHVCLVPVHPLRCLVPWTSAPPVKHHYTMHCPLPQGCYNPTLFFLPPLIHPSYPHKHSHSTHTLVIFPLWLHPCLTLSCASSMPPLSSLPILLSYTLSYSPGP
jgi:hypothetical protein